MPIIIEKVTYSQKGGGSYVVSLSDGSSFGGLDEGALKELCLQQGRDLSAAELAELQRRDMLHRAKGIAAHFINYRPRSRQEVADRLARAGIEEAVAEAVISGLMERGKLDDADFARQWVRGKALGGKSGAKLVQQQLICRGVSRRDIDAALAQELPREASLQAAVRLAEKKLAGKTEMTLQEKKKVQDYLLRRGFDWEIVKQAMKDGSQ